MNRLLAIICRFALLFACFTLMLPAFSRDGGDWAKTLTGPGDSAVVLMTSAGDDGVAILGTSKDDNNFDDMYLVKLDASGNMVWQRFFHLEHYKWFHQLIQTADKGFVVVGGVDTSATFSEGVIIKFKPDGQIEWQQMLSGALDESLNGVAEDAAGNLIAVGASSSSTFKKKETSAIIAKFDKQGKLLWQKQYGGDKLSQFWRVSIDADGYALAGNAYAGNAIGPDIWLVKTREDGAILWQKSYGGGKAESVVSFDKTHDGGYILADRSYSFHSNPRRSDVWLFKFDRSGDIVWHKLINNGDKETEFPSVIEQPDGNLLVSVISYFKSPKSGNDIHTCVLGLDASGDLRWQKRLNTRAGEQSAHEGQSLSALPASQFAVATISLSYNESNNFDVLLASLSEARMKSAPDTDFRQSSPNLIAGTTKAKFKAATLKTAPADYAAIDRRFREKDVSGLALGR